MSTKCVPTGTTAGCFNVREGQNWCADRWPLKFSLEIRSIATDMGGNVAAAF